MVRQTALGEMEVHLLTQRIYQQESRSKVVMRELVSRGGNWTRGYLFLLTAGSHRDGGENPRSRGVLFWTSLKNTSLSITMSRPAWQAGYNEVCDPNPQRGVEQG